MKLSSDDDVPRDCRPLPLVCIEIALVFAVFFLEGAWPTPDVNETVYLAHMKHFWNPDWAAGDLYLQSADAHVVVNWTVGWLSLLLPLPAFAWVGRIITWWLLAWSWRRLSFALAPRPWWAVISAALFACLQQRCQMAGEWVIGGLEAKGFAYVLVFLALEQLARNRWNATLTLLGAASAFHVLVGGWSAIATGFAWLFLGRQRPALPGMTWGLIAGFLLSLPGLWPALRLNAAATAEQVAAANEIYVFQRLPHHLSPQTFPDTLVLKSGLLFVAFVLIWLIAPRDLPWRRLAAFVAGSVAIALAGWLLSLATASNPALYAMLMRFYWFRLIDAMLPLGVTLGALHGIDWLCRLAPMRARMWLGVAAGIGLLHVGGLAVDRPFPARPRADTEKKVADYAAWRQMCDWVKQHTPPEALFLTPRAPQSFRWYADRGEVVNYKDLPQDAVTMLEWQARLKAVHGAPAGSVPPRSWLKSLTERTPRELRDLAARYHASYVVTDAQPPLDLPCVYRNETYAVYAVVK